MATDRFEWRRRNTITGYVIHRFEIKARNDADVLVMEVKGRRTPRNESEKGWDVNAHYQLKDRYRDIPLYSDRNNDLDDAKMTLEKWYFKVSPNLWTTKWEK